MKVIVSFFTVFLLGCGQLALSADHPAIQPRQRVAPRGFNQIRSCFEGRLNFLGGACHQSCNRKCCSFCGCGYFTRRECLEGAGAFTVISGMSFLIAKGVIAGITYAANAPGEGGHGRSYFDYMEK